MDNGIQIIIKQKLQHDVGILIYKYLNDIEDQIVKSITTEKLVKRYNIKMSSSNKNRGICPFCNKPKDKNALFLDDQNKSFICHACKRQGTFIEFIVEAEHITNKWNALSEAKIIAANAFTGMNLGFTSIKDFENQLTQLIINRYKKTYSLNLKDYYNICILPQKYQNTNKECNNAYERSISNNNTENECYNGKQHFALERFDIDDQIHIYNEQAIKTNEIDDYTIAIQNAKKSKLINDFISRRNELSNSELLYDFVGKKYNIDEQTADEYKLIYFEKANQKLLYYKDFFLLNGRLFFPFEDHETGITVGYQCRNVNQSLHDIPKYITACDYNDELTNKYGRYYRSFKAFKISNFLFNLYRIKNKNVSSLWITEGAADCIKLSSLGYDTVSGGQANISDYQVYLIKKYFGQDIQINIFFDNDADNNLTGQNRSIANAYKLWQFGFYNIHIIRTYKEIGKDLTDCSVKLMNDDILKNLLDIWEKESYIFAPASEENINTLINTGIYTISEVLSVDPRSIDKTIEFANFINSNFFLKDKSADDLKALKKMSNYPLDSLNAFILSNNKTEYQKKEPTKLENEIPTTNKKEEQISQYDLNTGLKINDVSEYISDRQLYSLQRKFDDDTIYKICTICNKKQINSIVGKIVKNKEFNINDYLHKQTVSNTSKDSNGFIEIDCKDKELPF